MGANAHAHAPALAAMEGGERRRIQRFIASRRGVPYIWLRSGDQRTALRDISIEGFSIGADVPLGSGSVFEFVLEREGVPDRIRGRAEPMNCTESAGQIGCRFVELEVRGAERLRDWLIALVIMNASVRISEKDAAAIVAGPSLI
ncbi:PilZ domain-containing protein [Thauera sp. ZXT1-4]|uniref:PilZ domain-containing protein n=1 Tax=Thauera sp. ZXT1-4 TaxID=3460294 RepID=UPI0040407B69